MPIRYNPQGKAPSNVWLYTTPIRGWGNGKQNYLNPIPFQLAEKIISISSDKNDVIFDPFAGSGSVLALASLMERRAYGIDINRHYKKRFEMEVIEGAKTYWEKRKLELLNNSKAIIDFKKTNTTLRKLKVVAAIAKYYREIYPNPFVYILLNKSGLKFDLLIVENEIIPKKNITDESINMLIMQSKVEPNICIISKDEIETLINDSKLNRYPINKFYSNIGNINRDNILKSKNRFEYIFSNINLRIK